MSEQAPENNWNIEARDYYDLEFSVRDDNREIDMSYDHEGLRLRFPEGFEFHLKHENTMIYLYNDEPYGQMDNVAHAHEDGRVTRFFHCQDLIDTLFQLEFDWISRFRPQKKVANVYVKYMIEKIDNEWRDYYWQEPLD